MKKLIAYTIVAILMIQLTVSNTILANTLQAPSDWAKTDIEALIGEGILREELFRGYDQFITREAYAYLVYKLVESYGISISSIGDLSMDFDLIDTQDFYVIGLYKAGIITGYPDDTYRPNQPITRQEICTLYVKAIELIGGSFDSDETLLFQFADGNSIASWARTSIAKALNMGILKGTSSNGISPLGYSTVEESLVIFNRIIKNKEIQADKRFIQQTVYSQELDYYKGLGYFLNKQLDGSINGVKVYVDFKYKETYLGAPIEGDFQVTDLGIYYINDENLMLYDIEGNGTNRLVEDVTDFVVVGSEIFCLNNDLLVQVSLQGMVVNQVLFKNNLVDLKAYTDNDTLKLYVLDSEGVVYEYMQGEIAIVATQVSQYEVLDSGIYYINEASELIYENLKDKTSERLESNVTDFSVVGNNLLYIIEGTWLYNTYRGRKTLLYTGNDLRMACDYNYLVLTETIVGDSDYNHLIALFNVKEYLGYIPSFL